MDTLAGLIPHRQPEAAGSFEALSEKPVAIDVTACRPHASSSAYSLMLGLLEISRNVALSGREPAPFLIVLLESGRSVLVANATAGEIGRVWNQYGPVALAFLVSARHVAGGMWLQVSEPSGRTGYRLDQFCAGCEALPHCWSRESASSAYQSTSGLIPNWIFRNSSLLNHLIS